MSDLATGVRGRVFSVQRFSIHDGPGIRTTVFLKGCVLRCLWCHNPESQAPGSEISFQPDKCIGCGYCVRTCPEGAHAFAEGGRHTYDRGRCVRCGACTTECYAGALERVGEDRTVPEVLAEVLADRPFYGDVGGLTLSGGEPLLQIDFAEALLQAARDEGVHTCVETCGSLPWDRLARVRELVDLFLWDCKDTREEAHRELTGAPLAPILANLRRLHDLDATILLRCPLVPGVNATEAHFAGLAELCRELPRLTGVELMPYHRLGSEKQARLGLTAQPTFEVPSPETVAAWRERLLELGVPLL